MRAREKEFIGNMTRVASYTTGGLPLRRAPPQAQVQLTERERERERREKEREVLLTIKK